VGDKVSRRGGCWLESPSALPVGRSLPGSFLIGVFGSFVETSTLGLGRSGERPA